MLCNHSFNFLFQCRKQKGQLLHYKIQNQHFDSFLKADPTLDLEEDVLRYNFPNNFSTELRASEMQEYLSIYINDTGKKYYDELY